MSARVRLVHLNADSSWLLVLEGSAGPFRLLLDPWLSGQQVDFVPSFSVQSHGADKPRWSSIEQVERDFGCIDAVWISHDFTDHCHRETLTQLSPRVPIFASTAEAVSRVKGFNHFSRVIAVPKFDSHRDALPCGTVLASVLAREQGVELGDRWPASLSFVYLPTTKLFDFARLHGAAMLAFDGAEVDMPDRKTLSLCYSPHGLPASSIEAFSARHGAEMDMLALLTSLDKVTNPWYLAGVIALGHTAAVAAALLLKPRLLVSTHDERDKEAKGLISHTLKRDVAPSLDAMQSKLDAARTKVVTVSNGESLSLL